MTGSDLVVMWLLLAALRRVVDRPARLLPPFDLSQAALALTLRSSRYTPETFMRSLLSLAAAAALSSCALAQPVQDHVAHHPAGASAPAATTSQSSAKPAVTPGSPPAAAAKMDGQMKSMHRMHEKMAAAKTPEERRALMGEHMKAMQEGMAMMGQMKTPGDTSASTSSSPDMAGKRLDMMEMMMQMMIDREAVRAPAGK